MYKFIRKSPPYIVYTFYFRWDDDYVKYDNACVGPRAVLSDEELLRFYKARERESARLCNEAVDRLIEDERVK